MTLHEIMGNKRGRKDLKLHITRTGWESEDYYLILTLNEGYANTQYHIKTYAFDSVDFLDANDIIADDWKIAGE